jgi:methylenetetrahydrofolate dehydrogenase (NADP+)/methenyltetrahydrofolate cyclohydrolase
MPLIIDGKIARNAYAKELKLKVLALEKPLKLGIVQVGNDSRSTLYIGQKEKCGVEVGINVEHVHLPETVSFEELKKKLDALSLDDSFTGIIVQLPLPSHLEKQKVIDCIDPKKDVDGLTTKNKEFLNQGDPIAFIPATALGIFSLLAYYKIPVKGKKVAVLGRSDLVGIPTAIILRQAGAEVTVCHSKTPNTKEIVQNSEIVIVAIGKPHFIDESFVNRNHIIIDVGINPVAGVLIEEFPDKKVVGDVDFAKVALKVSAISPVPGGVGPMTVISLFKNVFIAGYAKMGIHA